MRQPKARSNPGLGFLPYEPKPPASRGDDGKTPLKRCAQGEESRHVNAKGKTGFPKRMK